MLSPQRVSPDQADGLAPGALSRALLASVFVIAACGLVYELVAGAAASYLLGDSVTQFSLVIGIYLSAMGVGAWVSRRIETDVARRFVEVELGVALLGGASAPLLFLSFARAGWFQTFPISRRPIPSPRAASAPDTASRTRCSTSRLSCREWRRRWRTRGAGQTAACGGSADQERRTEAP